ncbi:Stk1 family PASTA domain-containing Ser/Thr kinase [Tuberibacillus sp. Marseille-P3662]|uniref:Stk1 family PASTA domain-containing Ser/Thr kinase n=1 Tax=Tuberibacillus sp. Marseille-P3662 TaxID=1965358 RepID=UPI000A1C901F|nr:Stk1 family PASTA domain-containing Ser/Thr kinase [Tuberibacillus sp. Marseille-P3662]
MIGEKINDRYKVISRIGDGGMAVVYKAKDLILDRLVAVKLLRSEYAEDEAFIKRFRREAESVASLSHESIVSIYDIGEEADLYYIVMEYIDGDTLKDYIKQYAPLSEQEAISISKQIASAIEHAHQHGIVHRDIKPHNILIDEQGLVKVTDFGIALAMTSATITYTNSIMGSAHYLSPEQAKGEKGTIKSDIYALGIVMYEMLTGQLPYPGDSPVSVALKHINEQPALPKTLRPDLSQSLENVIIRALAKNPDHRYDDIGALYDDLETALQPDRVTEPRISLPSDDDEDQTKIIPVPDQSTSPDGIYDNVEQTKPYSGEQQSDQSQQDAPKKKKKGKKALWWSIALIGIAILAILAFFLVPKFLAVDNVQVPDLKGKTYSEAVDTLRENHLYNKRKNVTNDDVEAGKIVSQTPQAGQTVKKNATVNLIVSQGPEQTKIKDYTGLTETAAKNMIDKDQFQDVVWKETSSEDVEEGKIIKQTPASGEEVVASEVTLSLTVSTGVPTAKVPDVQGLSQSDAREELENAGFDADFSEGEYSEDVQKDHVLKTDPASGETVQEGSQVTVYLSKGPEQKPVTIQREITVNVQQQPQNDKKDKDKKDKEKDKKNSDKKTNKRHVQIYYSDVDHNNSLLTDETIKKTKTYQVPLTIEPGGSGHYKVVADGEVISDQTIQYKTAKKEAAD